MDRIGYLAGLFDGEGSIYGGLNPKPCLHIVCTMTTPDPLKLFHEAFGGSLKSYAPTKGQKTPMWRWGVCSAIEQEAFLTAVLPWLIVKKPQAELALQYLQTIKKGLHLTEEVFDLRASIVRTLSELNCKKGRNAHRKDVEEKE